MSKIIVDGYNLIHRVPELRKHLETSLEHARDQLTGLLKTYLLNKKIDITVVFDGAESLAGIIEHEQHSSLKVVFSRHPFKADPLILSLIEREKQKKSLTIVSDDGEIARYAQAKNAVVLSTESFYHRLTRQEQSGEIDKKFDQELTQEELTEWLKIFGEN